MKQTEFEWTQEEDRCEQVTFDPQVKQAALALMARVLIAVVCAVEVAAAVVVEVADDRLTRRSPTRAPSSPCAILRSRAKITTSAAVGANRRSRSSLGVVGLPSNPGQ